MDFPSVNGQKCRRGAEVLKLKRETADWRCEIRSVYESPQPQPKFKGELVLFFTHKLEKKY